MITKIINLFETSNTKEVLLNYKDAAKLGQKAGERVTIKNLGTKKPHNKYWIAILQIAHSDSILSAGEIGIFENTLRDNETLNEGDEVSLNPAKPPDSHIFIRKKISKQKLNADEINRIIADAVSGSLSRIEISSFITGIEINGADKDEMTALTIAEAESGERFNFGPEVYDKHST
ncbi:MAG: hypothetical protein P8Y97_05275 [Candidatus Lokiarchaeota archaeon]